MRLIVSIQREREPLSIRAAAEPSPEKADGRWTIANMDVKSVVAVIGVSLSLLAIHNSNVTKLAELSAQVQTYGQQQPDLVRKVEGNTNSIATMKKSLDKDFVPRPELEIREKYQRLLTASEIEQYFTCTPRTKGPR